MYAAAAHAANLPPFSWPVLPLPSLKKGIATCTLHSWDMVCERWPRWNIFPRGMAHPFTRFLKQSVQTQQKTFKDFARRPHAVSMGFHWIERVFMGFHGFPWAFMGFHGFSPAEENPWLFCFGLFREAWLLRNMFGFVSRLGHTKQDPYRHCMTGFPMGVLAGMALWMLGMWEFVRVRCMWSSYAALADSLGGWEVEVFGVTSTSYLRIGFSNVWNPDVWNPDLCFNNSDFRIQLQKAAQNLLTLLMLACILNHVE